MLRIFIPDSYANHRCSGYIYGAYIERENVCIIMNIGEKLYPEHKMNEISQQFKDAQEEGGGVERLEFALLGVWADQKAKIPPIQNLTKLKLGLKVVRENSHLVVMDICDESLCEHCFVTFDNACIYSKSFHHSIQYKNYFYENWKLNTSAPDNGNKCLVPKEDKLLKLENFLTTLDQNIPHLYVAVTTAQKLNHKFQKFVSLPFLSKARLEINSLLFVIVSFCLNLLGLFYAETFRLLQFMLLPLRLLNPVIRKCGHASATLCHISDKCKLLSKLFVLKDTSKAGKTSIESQNIIFALWLDAVLGLVFCWMVLPFKITYLRLIGKMFIPYIELIAEQVEDLIHWLMGVPIGLKLNLSLNQFLGTFFLHHVRLWLEYLRTSLDSIASSEILQYLIYGILWLSSMGFTFLLAAASDVVSLLTFHVYCFYIYAARLFQLQLTGIISLSRLFRGKKWNPLRGRVDTLPDGGEWRFFTGTLLFTILCFLFPTTALYYAIFTFLRLFILLVQTILAQMRKLLTFAPWFSVFARLLFPLSNLHQLNFVWLDPDIEKQRSEWEGRPLHVLSNIVCLQFTPKRFSKVWTENYLRSSNPDDSKSGLGHICNSVIYGKIIKS